MVDAATSRLSGPSTDAGAFFLNVSQSLLQKPWRPRLGDDRLALTLSQRLGVPEIVGRVLAGRNVSLEEADDFLEPSLRRLLPDPSTIPDMDKAARRFADAITTNGQIAVFGDYGVDGATSSAFLVMIYARAWPRA